MQVSRDHLITNREEAEIQKVMKCGIILFTLINAIMS